MDLNIETFKTQIDTLIGPLTLTASASGLQSIEFKKTKKRDQNKFLSDASEELGLYFKGKLKKFSVSLDINGTEFQKKSWKCLVKIPYGKTISYKDQAIKLGGTNYARAVAGANNKNKLPIIIPCHRVIGSNGSLVGYAGGLKVKKLLIDLENR